MTNNDNSLVTIICFVCNYIYSNLLILRWQNKVSGRHIFVDVRKKAESSKRPKLFPSTQKVKSQLEHDLVPAFFHAVFRVRLNSTTDKIH